MHVIHPRAIQAGAMPPNIQVIKLFWSEHVVQIKAEFESVKTLGSAAAEEWIKGLEIRGKQTLADASRWEKWAGSGGMAQLQAPKVMVNVEPSLSAPLDSLSPLALASPWLVQSTEEQQGQASFANEKRGSIVPLETSAQQPRTTIQQKRTKEEAAQLKAQRRTDIENRAMFLDPPLTANILAHIPSFQAALQLITPLDDQAWELLKPRLLAQREEAEMREKQSCINVLTLRESFTIKQAGEKTVREPREVTDQEWDDIQGPVRARISEYADEIIEGWKDGAKLKKKNCPQYAADVLLYICRRFYAEVAKDNAAVIAAGKKPIIEPPEGPWTQKLTLENMKWVFDVKVKPRTELMRKELFLCNGCLGGNGVLKFFGFEGVLQHYAAKHTTALSLGSVVVHWRAEWPEVPPFSPDPLAKEKAYYGNNLSNSTPQNVPIQQPYPSFQAGPPTGYALPTYGTEAPPFSHYSSGPPIPPIPMYGQTATHTYGPSYSTTTYYDPLTYPSYSMPFSSGVPYSSHGQFNSYTAPPLLVSKHSDCGTYSTYLDTDNVASTSSTHKHRFEIFVKSAQSVWSRIGHNKKIPPAVRAFVAIHHASKSFEETHNEILPLSIFIEATSKNKKLRALRALNGVSCRVCNDDNIFHVPQLARHFKTEHVENPMSQGRTHMDWRTDMIKMPENEQMAGLEAKIQGDLPIYLLVKQAIPWAFEQAFIDKYGLKPVPATPNNTPPSQGSKQMPAQDSTAVSHGRPREPRPQSEVEHMENQPQQPDYAYSENQSQASRLLNMSLSRDRPHGKSEQDIPHLRPASEVYGRKKIGVKMAQAKPTSQADGDASMYDDYSPPDFEKLRGPPTRSAGIEIGANTEHETTTYPDPDPTRPRKGTHLREKESSDYRDIREQRYSGEGRASSHNRSASVGNRPQDHHPIGTTSLNAAPSYMEVERRGHEESHIAQNHQLVEEEVIYVDECGREIGRGLRARNTLPREPRYAVTTDERFGEYARPSTSWYDGHGQLYYRECSPWSRHARPKCHLDPPAASDHIYYNRHSTHPALEHPSEVYDLVDVCYPDGDYSIRRPVRRDGRPYHAFGTRQPPREQSLLPQRITRGPSDYCFTPEANPHISSQSAPQPDYSDYDPRYDPSATGETPAYHRNQR
ncbi:hypothetical protein FBEOM_6038 [Fusarium beomiforme]|uniref:DUF7892 domain-containing protein n=1 Tax=Fusarium beomiforme TaxID=44412 RepID=A0A9P5DZ12_9HYPO|nr:hypothetical protein FBEOM_6038 [Fusarium beomiforme]